MVSVPFRFILPALFLMSACTHVQQHESRPNLMTTRVGNVLPPSPGWLAKVSEWHMNSPLKSYSVQVDQTMSYENEPSLRFEMKSADAWTGPAGSKTFRNELIPGDFPETASTRFYACSIYVPKDFPIEDNRLVLMQWWAETKSELGEEGRSPSMALRFSQGELSANIRYSDLRVITNPDAVSKESLFRAKLPLGRWNTFVFQAKWSFKSDGMVNVWMNEKLVADYRGPVGYNDDKGPLFKFGMYRNDTPQTYIVYFNGCREGASLEEVRARRFN